ncbi:MAG: TolC family protein [Aromatoleum sp.]|jgi:outer membrane protein TolC|uniref:TolC family protein n=1 Tax=Aromatoleum sp. TaxID=2307007 RepID=UPI00289578E6|nr:TolC family protein [Aromatoleum sp.]MDT3670595.1 TolC family protein [Aromatoleum sp.]
MKPHIAGLRSLRRAAGIVVLSASLAATSLSHAQDALPTPIPPLGADVSALLEHARSHNPAFAVDRAEAAAAHERIEPAGALPDPSFQLELMDFTNAMRGGSTTLVPGQVGETRYRIIQPIPGWGKRGLSEQAAVARAVEADANRDAAWVTMAAEIKAAWLRYYAADREAALNRDALTLLQSLEEITLSRYRLGLLPQQAVLRAQREITTQRLALVEVEQRRSGLAAALNALLGRGPLEQLAAPNDPVPLPQGLAIASLVERARSFSPTIASAGHGIEAAKLERDRTWRDRYPDFSVGVTNNRPRDGEPSSWDVMFEVMIPLQQGARRAREREAALMVSAADHRRASAESTVLGELGRAWSEFESGRRSLELLRGTLMPQAEATRDATRAAFSTGRVDFDTVIEAERQLVDTRLTLLKTEVAAQTALAEIEKLAGEVQ